MKKIDLFFEKLNSTIDYVVFKNFEKIDESLRGEFNFDISVNPDNKESFKNIITDFNLLEGINIYDFLNIEVFHYYMFDNGLSYHFHIHYGIIIGTGYIKEYSIQLPNNFYENFQFYKNVKVLSPLYYNEIGIIRNDIKYSSFIGVLYCTILGKEIKRTKRNTNLTFDYKRVRQVKFAFIKNVIAFLLKILQYIITGGRQGKKFYRKGYSIGIGGPDGSGKSTLASNLYNDLSDVFYVKRMSFGRLTPVSNTNFKSKNTNITYGIKKIAAAVIRLYIAYKILFFKFMNNVVITDRYYNFNGPGMDSFKLNDGMLMEKIERYLYSKIPKIDVMFVIKVPLSLAISRNDQRNKQGKESVEEIIERYSDFKNVKYFSKRTVSIKNEGSINQGTEKLLNELY